MNGPNVYWPLLLAVVREVVVLPLGSVIVAVTPPFRVAPLPVTVNWVTPAVPVDGETLAESAELLTDNRVDPEACKPPSSVIVQLAVYVPVVAGAVQVRVGVLAVRGLPPVILQAYVKGFCSGSTAAHVKDDVPLPCTVDGAAVTEYTRGGWFAGRTVRFIVLL